MKVAVLGASHKPHRYSYKAVKKLLGKGHEVYAVHPVIKDIEGLPVHASLRDLPETMDTITVYVSADISDQLADEILESGARRVIFNPGAENPALEKRLRDSGVEVVEACTLVMLSIDRF